MNALDLQSRKTWLGGGVALAVLILLAGWFLAIHPKRSDAADLRAQNASAHLQNTQLDAQNAALTRQGRHLAGYQAKLAEALTALPAWKNVSAFSQSLTSYAQRTGVNLTSISVGAPTPVVTAPTAVPTVETTDSASASSASTDSSALTAPTTTTTAAGPVSTTFTLQTTGTTEEQLAFLSAIRTGSRSALITSTQFGGETTGENVTLTAQVNVFSSRMPAAQLQQLRLLLKPSK